MAPALASRAVLAVVAPVLLLGACSRSGPSAASTTTTAPSTTTTATVTTATGAASGPVCSVATAALVSEKLGLTLVGPNVDRQPAATVCTYDNPSVLSQSATVQVTVGATPASFASGRDAFASHGERVTDVAGLGEEAFSATLAVANLTSTTVVARKGAVQVLVTTTAPTDRVPGLVSAVLALV